MSVSVVIPTYNAADYLREAILSVLAQTVQPDEIIVVDDGSSDHTRDVCAALGDKVRYIYQQNDGTFGAGARARAIHEARGEWVALLDHDDRWLPTKLEKQLRVLASYPQAGAIITRSRAIDLEGRHIVAPDGIVAPEYSGKTFEMSARDAFHLLLGETPFSASAGIVRASFIAEHGLTDPTQVGAGDWDLWLSVARFHPIAIVDEVLTEYRFSPGQFVTDKERLGKLLQRTLDQQREHLHPTCSECRERFQAGQALINNCYRVAARTYLDQYHTEARAGHLQRARSLLRQALHVAPAEVLRPRRSVAVVKNYFLGAMSQYRLR